MIEDVEEQSPRAPAATGTDVIALAVAAVLTVAMLAGFAVISIPDPRVLPADPRVLPPDPVPVRSLPPPCAATRSPMETVYRMFDLTSAAPAILSSCWSVGRAPGPAQMASYAGSRPVSLRVVSVSQRYVAGVLYAELTMRGTWSGTPPAGWASDEPRLVTLRKEDGGHWTIDEVRVPDSVP